MVQGQNLIEVVAILMKFDSNIPASLPVIRTDANCRGPTSHKHFKWYDSILRKEFSAATRESNFRIVHWNVLASNEEFFKYKGKLYQEATIMIGEETLYWYFANKGESNHSKKILHHARCSCCIGYRIEKLLNEIRIT